MRNNEDEHRTTARPFAYLSDNASHLATAHVFIFALHNKLVERVLALVGHSPTQTKVAEMKNGKRTWISRCGSLGRIVCRRAAGLDFQETAITRLSEPTKSEKTDHQETQDDGNLENTNPICMKRAGKVLVKYTIRCLNGVLQRFGAQFRDTNGAFGSQMRAMQMRTQTGTMQVQDAACAGISLSRTASVAWIHIGIAIRTSLVTGAQEVVNSWRSL